MYCYSTSLTYSSIYSADDGRINAAFSRKLRMIAMLMILIVILILAAALMIGSHETAAAEQSDAASMMMSAEEAHAIYEIKPGDTLWSIASSYAPDTVSIPYYIYLIEQLNDGIRAGALQSGMQIRLPNP